MVYERLMEEKLFPIDSHYSIAAYRKKGSVDYSSAVDYLLTEKSGFRCKSLFSSLIKAINGGIKETGFSQQQSFQKRLKKYCEDRKNEYQSKNVYYDLLLDGNSMLKKSVGEKSSLFINLLFCRIENDLKAGKSVLLLMDQPEDNIDNRNVFEQITETIKRLKVEYKGPQLIIITHNANVGITADSENIIIAEESLGGEKGKVFKYSSGCIENNSFIDKVCNTLEGGKEAMIQRSAKYGINVLKKIGDNNEL